MNSTLYFSYQGGWELDESTMEEAASRESLEEAGVLGNIEVISVSLEYCICHRQWPLESPRNRVSGIYRDGTDFNMMHMYGSVNWENGAS